MKQWLHRLMIEGLIKLLISGWKFSGIYQIDKGAKDIMEDSKYVSIREHYDMLIDEDNDPVYDPKPLKEYMDKSDGQYFIDCLNLTPMKDVMEIGVGTGRLAIRVAGKCNTFCGIDSSEKTVIRARKNLNEFDNVAIVLGDFLEYSLEGLYDVIYCSQVFWHICDKQKAIFKIAKLLKKNGTFVLSIDKVQPEVIDYGSRKLRMFPDNKEEILEFIGNSNLYITQIEEIENAYIIVAEKR